MSQPTHTVRAKHLPADKAEPVTKAQLEQMEQVFGANAFKTGYIVEPLAEKPQALATVAPKPAPANLAAPNPDQPK